MPKNSPPKYRHDGTSPLPMGMDWSPPPKRWSGKDTVWPHDPRTGWSYCVTIPSWIILPGSGATDGSSANPTAVQFYRVQVGVQSPQGISTSQGVLRRFSEFLKLFAELKFTFPKKNLPPPPPKHSFLRVNSSRQLLEERRYALEEWMGKLLSDIDLSRSVKVAMFLELESAARSLCQDVNQHNVDSNSYGESSVTSLQFQANSGASVHAISSDVSKALSCTPDYGSDNACETSELGTPRHGRDSSEIGMEDLVLDHDLAAPMGALVKYGISNNNGPIVGGSTLELPEEFPSNRMHAKRENSITGRDMFYGSASKDAFLSGDAMEFMSQPEHNKFASHARKHSSESAGSDISSIRGSEISITGVTNSLGEGFFDLPGDVEASITNEAFGGPDLHFVNNVHLVLPLDQRNKMSRVLTTMQRRLVTARTDMEDLIARLNQEIAVKDYLTTKVKDLDVELESIKQKSKENLQQAVLIERERVTQMQWDMEELRGKYLEMELKLKSEQDEKIFADSAKMSAIHEKELLLQELDVTREQLKNLQKCQEDLEGKSKADIKLLVKEVKSLRRAQSELKQEINQSLKDKAELERILQKEKRRKEHAKTARIKLLHECGILRNRLQECSVNFLAEEEDKFTVDSLSDALDLLTTSDNRIGLLLAEAQLLARDDESSIAAVDGMQDSVNINGDDSGVTDEAMRKMLTDIFIDNAKLRKQVNSIIRCALKTVAEPEKEDGEEAPSSRKTVLNKFLER